MPLKVRALPSGDLLHVSDDGRFFVDRTPEGRFVKARPDQKTHDALCQAGHAIGTNDALGLASFQYRMARRLDGAANLEYLIVVPTLRCNLSCSYCQVSRAPLGAEGFDWTDDTLSKVLALVDGMSGSRIKIEFQGGEPTLRPDLIEAVMVRCDRFDDRQFVICTNLQKLGPEQWKLFDRPDTFISTSLDGDFMTHARQRTGEGTSEFEQNLRAVIDRYGPTKVSALPTIDPENPPEPNQIIDTFRGLGLGSIFLRSINYQGFARKRHKSARDLHSSWGAYHRSFVRSLIDRNWADRSTVLEETYTSICLRRIFHPGADKHVDLRNPNPLGVDYLVIDHDGRLYPTDEARMLSRSGVIDLSFGMIGEDWRGETWSTLNEHSTNLFDPACSRCAYQPYCGRDLVDDLGRYGRVDLPRTETAFCQRHLGIFDFLFELIYDDSPAVRYSLARWLRLDADAVQLAEYLP